VVEDVAGTLAIGATPPVDFNLLQTDLERHADAALSSLITDDDRATLVVREVRRTAHRPAVAILDYARETGIDLIIMGTHGRSGMAEFFLGSVAQQVIRSAPCPVLTVRAHGREFVRPDALTVTAPA
jgi:universal stress protein A